MITPDKYFDLKNSVINVSASIIRALQKINVLTLLNKIEYNNSIYSFTIKK